MFISQGLTGGEREIYDPILNVEVNTLELAKNQSKENNKLVFNDVIEVHNIVENKNSRNAVVKTIETKIEKLTLFDKLKNEN